MKKAKLYLFLFALIVLFMAFPMVVGIEWGGETATDVEVVIDNLECDHSSQEWREPNLLFLSSGWNDNIQFDELSEGGDIDEILGSFLFEDGDEIEEDGSGETATHDGDDWDGDLTEISPEKKYYIKVSENVIVPVYDKEGEVVMLSSDSSNNCYRDEYDGGTCCSYGYECVEEGGDWKCKPEENPSDMCGSYETSEECGDFTKAVAEKSVKSNYGSDFCGSSGPEYTKNSKTCKDIVKPCYCEWYDGGCVSSWNITARCENDEITDTGIGKCKTSYSDIEDNCDTTGYMRYTISTEWEGDDNHLKKTTCEDKDGKKIQMRCVPRTLLSFLSFVSLILALILITLFYTTFRGKDRKNN